MSLHPARQLDEFRNGKGLGPAGEDGVLRARKIAENSLQRVAQHLAPLPERGFHDLDEEPFVALQLTGSVSSQADDGTLYFRRRIEDRFVNREEVFDVIVWLIIPTNSDKKGRKTSSLLDCSY